MVRIVRRGNQHLAKQCLPAAPIEARQQIAAIDQALELFLVAFERVHAGIPGGIVRRCFCVGPVAVGKRGDS